MYIYVYVYVCVCVYIYIYIHSFRLASERQYCYMPISEVENDVQINLTFFISGSPQKGNNVTVPMSEVEDAEAWKRRSQDYYQKVKEYKKGFTGVYVCMCVCVYVCMYVYECI
jgi:hypothetical protein